MVDILNLISDIAVMVVMFLFGIAFGIIYTYTQLRKQKVIETKKGTYTFSPKNPILGNDK